MSTVGQPERAKQIRVYADKLKVWNAGELPENWSVATLLGEHSSRPCNPSVANAFFRAGEIETWGRGVQRIMDACREAGAPEPSIRYQPGDLWVEFPFPAEYLAVVPAGRNAGIAGNAPVETPVETRVKTPVKVMKLLAERPTASLAEVATAIGKSLSAVERASSKLVKEGRLRFVGPRKGGHWEVLK